MSTQNLIPYVKKGDYGAIKRILQRGEFSLDETDVSGNTPLHIASEAPRCELRIMEILLKHGFNPNISNSLGNQKIMKMIDF